MLSEGNPTSLKEAQDQIVAIMEREELAVKEAAEDSANSSLTLESDIANTKSSGSNSAANVNANINQKKESEEDSSKTVCKFFLRQACKHGRKGNDCTFSHPKVCFKYTRHGDRRGGCKKGTNCEFVHPRLCNSYKSGVCSRAKCGLFHVKGTKSQVETDNKRVLQRHTGLARDAQPSPRHEARDNVIADQAHYRSSYVDACNAARNNKTPIQNEMVPNSNDFLEIKMHLKQLQDQMQLLLSTRAPSMPRMATWGNA